jgi:hypothetical protein
VNGAAQLRVVRVASDEGDKCLLEELDVVRLHMGELSLLAKRPDDRRSTRVATKKAPHPHNLSSINERVGDGFRLWLLNSLGESLSECVHGDVRVVRPSAGLTDDEERAKDARIGDAQLFDAIGRDDQ